MNDIDVSRMYVPELLERERKLDDEWDSTSVALSNVRTLRLAYRTETLRYVRMMDQERQQDGKAASVTENNYRRAQKSELACIKDEERLSHRLNDIGAKRDEVQKRKSELPKAPQKTPCESCPYRADAPSGLWDESEYKKLPAYDNETPHQPTLLFMCHQGTNRVCGGWAHVHDMQNSLAMRIARHQMLPQQWEKTLNYSTDIDMLDSGQAAYDRGMYAYTNPSDRTKQMIARIQKKRGLK